MASEDQEKVPFLHHEEPSVTTADLAISREPREKNCLLRAILIVLSLTCLTSNTFWWVKFQAMAKKPCTRPQLIFSPAIEAISYEKRTLWRSIESENAFAGDPRHDPTTEHDAKWRELVKPMAMKITPEELAMLGEPSIALKDGSGYLAEMAVFHELHCIKRIRRHFHLQHYYGNLTQSEDFMDREWRHMDHCLEYWREAATCRGDPTLTTFVWNEGRPFSKLHSTHECVDWQKLYRFAESRMVDVSDLDIFSHLSGHDEGY